MRTSRPLEFEETSRPLPELSHVSTSRENKTTKRSSRSISRDVEYKLRKSSNATKAVMVGGRYFRRKGDAYKISEMELYCSGDLDLPYDQEH
jgi:hypothetical protein